jgi:glutathione S-transferase
MYKLYWHPQGSAAAIITVLEELGLPYDLREIHYETGYTKSEEYLKISPLGLFPSIEIEGMDSIFESAAIVLFLCDRHQDNTLAPNLGDPDRARFLQWLFYLSNTVYTTYTRYWHPERYTTTPECEADAKEQMLASIMKLWAGIEDILDKDGPWLLGERFSACDIYLQMITTWHGDPAELLDTYPNIKKLCRRVVERPASQRTIELHDFKTGFE